MQAYTWMVLKIVLAIAGFVLFLALIQLFVSIHPPRYYDDNKPSDYGLEYENVSFTTADKIKIKGWLIMAENARGTVIVGHGYPFSKGNILPVAKFLYPEYNLLFYDHRYLGESSGKITTIGIKEVEDVKAAVRFVRSRLGEDEKIALYGFSLSAAAMLMAKQDVNAIVADSSYADLEMMLEHVYAGFGIFKLPFVKLTKLLARLFLGVDINNASPVNAVKDYDAPILVIHGKLDSQIPVENAYKLKASNPAIELWVVDNADHGQAYALAKQKYEARIKSFLKMHIN